MHIGLRDRKSAGSVGSRAHEGGIEEIELADLVGSDRVELGLVRGVETAQVRPMTFGLAREHEFGHLLQRLRQIAAFCLDDAADGHSGVIDPDIQLHPIARTVPTGREFQLVVRLVHAPHFGSGKVVAIPPFREVRGCFAPALRRSRQRETGCRRSHDFATVLADRIAWQEVAVLQCDRDDDAPVRRGNLLRFMRLRSRGQSR